MFKLGLLSLACYVGGWGLGGELVDGVGWDI